MAESETRPEERSRRRTAERPTELPGGSWWAAVKRTVREFQVDDLRD